MQALMNNPAVPSAVLPFAAAFFLAMLIRAGGGPDAGRKMAIAGAVLAYLGTYWLIEGIAPFPPVAAMQKLMYLIALAFAVGMALDLANGGVLLRRIAVAFYPLIAALWLAENTLVRGPDIAFILKLLAIWLAGFALLALLDRATRTEYLAVPDAAERGGIHAPTLLMVTGFAGAAISFMGAFLGFAQLSAAAGASLAGYMLVNYVDYIRTGRSFGFGATGVIGLGGAWLAGAYVAVLYGLEVNSLAFGVLILVFIADSFARRMRLGRGARSRTIEPILYGLVAVIPAIAAVAIAFTTFEPGGGY